MVVALLHQFKEHVDLHGLRHINRLHKSVLCHRSAGLVGNTEELFGIQHGHHIIDRALEHRVQTMGTGGDHFLPGGHIVVNIQRLNILAMGRKLAGVLVVKLKNIDDHLLLGLVKNALLTAHIYQHTDFFFRHLFIVPIRVNAQNAQHQVGRGSEQPHQRGKEFRGHIDQPGHTQGDLLGLFHCHPLGHQFAKHQSHIRQDDGNNDHGNGIQRAFFDLHAQIVHQPAHNHIGEVVRRKGAAQKAGQGNGDLNGGEKARRFFRQLTQSLRSAVAVLCQLFQLQLVHRNDGDLRAGKNGVDRNQNNLNKKLPPKGYVQKEFLQLINNLKFMVKRPNLLHYIKSGADCQCKSYRPTDCTVSRAFCA